MLEHLERAVLALAQPVDVQLSLFPDFVCKADELALDLKYAIGLTAPIQEDFTSEQRDGLAALDGQLLTMSGKENSDFWTDEALRSHLVWARVRQLAKGVLAAFEWPMRRPPRSDAIYIRGGT